MFINPPHDSRNESVPCFLTSLACRCWMLPVLNSQQSQGPSHHQALASAPPGMGFKLHPMERLQGPPEMIGKDMEDAE